jgi:phosphoribosylanthranilate isomerase
LSILALAGCNENLLEKPDNLISEDKMVEVLKDLAIVNAAKTTNIAVLQDNDIEPMDYIYEKHGIDSVQFVESDRYYASLPKKYEQIYKKVESRLEKETKKIEEEKRSTTAYAVWNWKTGAGKPIWKRSRIRFLKLLTAKPDFILEGAEFEI